MRLRLSLPLWLPPWATLPLLALLACRPVPATLDLPDDRPTPEPVARKHEPVARTRDFDPAATLRDCEQLLVAIDRNVEARAGHWEPMELEAMHSWLYDEGLRSLYYYAGEVSFSLGRLALTFDTPVFTSGPHTEQADLESRDFGHYNPLFVERVALVAEALGRDQAAIQRTRPSFQHLLRRQARTYLLVHQALHRNPEWYEGLLHDYQDQLDGRIEYVDRFEEFRPMLEGFSRNGMTWYETDTAMWFWLRRDLDGTDALWVNALEALLKAYDAMPGPPPAYPG